MALFPNRYRIRVVGTDGLVRTKYSDHALLIPFDMFLLCKNMTTEAAKVTCFDTMLKRYLEPKEIYLEDLEDYENLEAA